MNNYTQVSKEKSVYASLKESVSTLSTREKLNFFGGIFAIPALSFEFFYGFSGFPQSYEEAIPKLASAIIGAAVTLPVSLTAGISCGIVSLNQLKSENKRNELEDLI